LVEAEREIVDLKTANAAMANAVEQYRIRETELQQHNVQLETELQMSQQLNHKLDTKRVVLLNQVQDPRGNIRVFARVHAATDSEAGRPQCEWNFNDDEQKVKRGSASWRKPSHDHG
jgi:predicted  nucleic acid-binding Zn-ribbon protein